VTFARWRSNHHAQEIHGKPFVTIEALLFVQVAKLDAEQVDLFVREVASVQEVRTVFLVSGHFDLIVHLAVRDMEQLKLVISEHFNRHACVLHVETSVVFNRRTQHSIPIEALKS
jgi:DNA-binding Lrp family transcriptional regulator